MTSTLSLRTALVLAAALPLLSGCFGAAVVAAGGGALLIADRRAPETYVTDEGIELRITTRALEAVGKQIHINVTSYNRTVLLSGEAENASVRAEVERIAAAAPNVRAISNEIVVGATSSLSARANDALITSKVKGRFIDHNKFAANHVKVITEAGTVFLLGIVTQAEADAAVDIARTTGGVQKVVRVFEIVSPEQARTMDGGDRAAK